VLRLWKFTEHHSGFPDISYVDKCVFRLDFPTDVERELFV